MTISMTVSMKAGYPSTLRTATLDVYVIQRILLFCIEFVCILDTYSSGLPALNIVRFVEVVLQSGC